MGHPVCIHLAKFFYRLGENACYERNRTSVWLYFDMSEITVDEEYRDVLTALLEPF